MKRIIFLILLACGSLLSLMNAASFSFQENISASRQFQSERFYSTCTSSLPETDQEINSHQNIVARSANSRNHNFIGEVIVGARSKVRRILIADDQIEDHSAPHLKKYLSHIYPTHNFW